VTLGESAPAVLVMAKAPEPGRVKTRLQPVFSGEECAAIQRVLVRRTARWAADVAGAGAAYVAHYPPQGWGALAGLVPPGVELFPQAGGNFGERLANAVDEVFGRTGAAAAAKAAPAARPLLVVGVDTRLTPEHASAALTALAAGADVVFGPALDGGYYLVGLKRPAAALFDLPPQGWGGPDVLALSLAAAHAAGLTTALLPPERDLDTPADAEALSKEEDEDEDPGLRHLLRRPLVSIVVPTRDEASAMPGLLDHLARLPGRFEVIVADGGSRDGTPQLATTHPLGPRVVEHGGGRAAQLNAGAAAASGDPIVFLHADTRLPASAYASLISTSTKAAGGNFAIRFDGGDLFSCVLGAWYRAQRRLGVYYGDSAIWLRRAAFDALGGFRPLPIMDDYDLARRLEKGFPTACLPGPAVTSARRWRALGVPRTVLSWVVIRWLFVAGVPPERLAHLYRRAR
jgi:rSAM/selenodomain-associated transferase 2/rSAM/selenodomain-associated transferase 1